MLEPLADPAVDIATLAIEIRDAAERDNPNIVKAVAALGPDRADRARALFHPGALPVGRRAALSTISASMPIAAPRWQRFVQLPPGRLEQREKLEQLRALEAGMRIDVALVDTVPFGVDTPADLERARALLQPRNPRDCNVMSDPADTIAFQGAPGAYSDLACRTAFPGDDDACPARPSRRPSPPCARGAPSSP